MTGAVFGIFGVPFRGSISHSPHYRRLLFRKHVITRPPNLDTNAQSICRQPGGAIVVGFLPAFELSGFLFEIEAMPAPLHLFTYTLPPRYFVSSLQTLFLVGDVPAQLLVHISLLSSFAIVLFAALVWVTPTRLE